jgi:hypothetical protein
VRVGICAGDGGCASWGGVHVVFASWGGQVRVFKLGCSSQGVQVGCCAFLVSIFRWSKPPHHVKVNPLGEVNKVYYNSTTSIEIRFKQDHLNAFSSEQPREQVLGVILSL